MSTNQGQRVGSWPCHPKGNSMRDDTSGSQQFNKLVGLYWHQRKYFGKEATDNPLLLSHHYTTTTSLMTSNNSTLSTSCCYSHLPHKGSTQQNMSLTSAMNAEVEAIVHGNKELKLLDEFSSERLASSWLPSVDLLTHIPVTIRITETYHNKQCYRA